MNGQQNGEIALQLSLPGLGPDNNTPDADYQFPEKLMGWLSRRAQSGSAYVRLDASCDGNRGSIIVTSYDEHDRCLADETFDLYEIDYLMAA